MGKFKQNLQRFIICVGLASVALISGCSSQKAADTASDILTLRARTGSVETTVTFIGNVSGGQTETILWSTGGVIANVDVKLGDQVHEGQILAELEPDSLSSDVLTAEIPYITALEELEEILASETPKAEAYNDLKEKEYALEKAEKYKEGLKYPRALRGDMIYWQKQVEDFRQLYDESVEALHNVASWRHSTDKYEHNKYEDYRKAMLEALNTYAEVYNNYLYYTGNPTENEFEQAAANIDVARADYEKALKVFRTFGVYPREKDINNAQLNISNARKTFNRRNIIASINGEVTQVKARKGDYVADGTAALRIDNTDHLYIPIDISELDILSIHDGMKAEIILDANRDRSYEGVVTTVSAAGSEADNRVTFQTMVEILDPDENVKIGMTAEVNLVIAEAHNVLIVPSNAVFLIDNDRYVGVYNGSVCNDVPVTTGLISDTVTEITGGFLKEGDSVCVPSADEHVLKAMGLSKYALNDHNEGTPDMIIHK